MASVESVPNHSVKDFYRRHRINAKLVTLVLSGLAVFSAKQTISGLAAEGKVNSLEEVKPIVDQASFLSSDPGFTIEIDKKKESVGKVTIYKFSGQGSSASANFLSFNGNRFSDVEEEYWSTLDQLQTSQSSEERVQVLEDFKTEIINEQEETKKDIPATQLLYVPLTFAATIGAFRKAIFEHLAS